jgi:hypothetical protein
VRLPKLTDEKRARLMEVAALKAQLPAFRDLAQEVGLSQLYTKQLVSQMVRAIRHESDVSPKRRHAHKSPEEFERIVAQVMR